MIKNTNNSPSLFSSLSDMLNQSHPLYRLADKIDWGKFETAFQPLYCQDNGRPGKPIRLMCGLLILKHLRNLSDESLVEQWSENAYYQYFCGMQEFTPSAPCASSELVHFRKRIGEKGIELIFQESIRVNNDDDDGRHHDTAFIDSTVQEKNITYPTDAKLHKKIVKKVLGIVKKLGLPLRQSYTFVLKKSDYRLGRNFYKGVAGDAVNVLLAAAAYNFKRAMKALLCMLQKIYEILCLNNISQKWDF